MRTTLLLSLGLLACGASLPTIDSDGGTGDGSAALGDLAGADLVTPPTVDLTYAPDATAALARPYMSKVPTGYNKNTPTPLVILLHGYTATGLTQEAYFKLGPLADARTFLYAYPDGTIDSANNHFWNATDSCCNFFGSNVDDVGYVNAIIDDMSTKYNVDPKRIFVVGHSNGGFMSHRLACDLSDRVAAIVSLAGAVYKDPARCVPESKISILEVHGDADLTISYNGGHPGGNANIPEYPSARDTVTTWATKNACTGALLNTNMNIDIDGGLAGYETRVDAFAGCPSGIAVELWTIQGGGHLPGFNASWASSLYGFLAAHPKP